jgi:hypothetical protein
MCDDNGPLKLDGKFWGSKFWGNIIIVTYHQYSHYAIYSFDLPLASPHYAIWDGDEGWWIFGFSDEGGDEFMSLVMNMMKISVFLTKFNGKDLFGRCK